MYVFHFYIVYGLIEKLAEATRKFSTLKSDLSVAQRAAHHAQNPHPVAAMPDQSQLRNRYD